MNSKYNIKDLEVPMGPLVYYRSDFRDVIEMHIPLIKERGLFSIIEVDPANAYKNENDFYGLLSDLKIDQYLFWPTLRLNGYHHPTEFDGETLSIMSPDISFLDQLRQMHTTIHVIR